MNALLEYFHIPEYYHMQFCHHGCTYWRLSTILSVYITAQINAVVGKIA